MNVDFNNYLLQVTKATHCSEVEIIQSLWSGYGKISRYQLIYSDISSVVVKHICTTQSVNHPRGWNTDFSHQRKVTSYQVETNWYQNWNGLCNKNCRTAKFIGSFMNDQEQWIVLEDLDAHFPIRKHQTTIAETKVCLKWLAHFHANFITKKPNGLWEIGTYWNLATRPQEWENIKNEKVKSSASLIDAKLTRCRFQTLVHGDSKLANFCFSEDGTEVAAVDFQYVGGGCGMKDVAYFLGSCLSSKDCETHEKELLDYYFSQLQVAFEPEIVTFSFSELEKEWRGLYPWACADFTRFLMGWMPSHHKINDYNLNKLKEVLNSL